MTVLMPRLASIAEHWQPMTVDRYGGFVQLSYRFGDVTTPATCREPTYYKALPPLA